MQPCPQTQENIERSLDPGIYRTMRPKESVGIRSKPEAIGSASRFGISGEPQKGNLSRTDAGENAHFPREYRQDPQRRQPRRTEHAAVNAESSGFAMTRVLQGSTSFDVRSFPSRLGLHALPTCPAYPQRSRMLVLTGHRPISPGQEH
jgi:hypothetical protein